MKGPTRRGFFAQIFSSLFAGSAVGCLDSEVPAAPIPGPDAGSLDVGEEPDMATYDVVVYGPSGPLSQGAVITGASNVAAVRIENDIVRYYPVHVAGPEGQLDRKNVAGTYTRALDSSRGDGAFFCTPQTNPPDSITVVIANVNEVELACTWNAWNLNTGYLGTPGVGYRDFNNPGPGLNYEQVTATPKYITSSKVVKTVVVKRGAEGVFLGWHSEPRVGPLSNQIPAYNNATDWAEREFQLGVNIQVSFCSGTNDSAQHPDWGSDAIWGSSGGGANYAFIRHFWYGIDDANYPPYDQAGYIARQPSGYPHEQTSGPFWFAGLHYQNATTYPFAVYMVLREKLECGAFQFAPSQYGQPTLHFANEIYDSVTNLPHRTICFIGAMPYTSANLTLEPTGSLRTAIAARASAASFDQAGQIALVPDTVPEAGELVDDAIVLYRGEETGFLLYATADGTAQNLDGSVIEATVRTDPGDPDPPHVCLYTGAGITHLTQTGSGVGGFYLQFTPSATNAIPAGVHYLDVVRVSGGSRKYMVKPRKVIVRNVVNQP